MEKKIKIILAGVVMCVAVATGIFYWYANRETPPEKWDVAKISPRENYIIKETIEGKVVENKKVGLKCLIPEGWVLADNPPDVSEVVFNSSDMEIGEEVNDIFLKVLQRGCRIHVSASDIKTSIDVLEKEIEERKTLNPSLLINEYERTEIDGRIATKHTFGGGGLKMYFILVHVPEEKDLYEIGLLAASQDKDRCEVEFNKFLETVVID